MSPDDLKFEVNAMEWMKLLTEFNVYSVLVRLLLAALMGGLIGSERGRQGRAAGRRTHILVCVGSAMTALTGLFIGQLPGCEGDVVRISAQVVSGIGFLGAGMILVRNSSVITGLTTAAGMWATAAIGIALGYGFYIGAFMATLLCIFTVAVLGFSNRRREKNTMLLYAELKTPEAVEEIFEWLQEQPLAAALEVLPPKSGIQGHVGLLVPLSDAADPDEVRAKLSKQDAVAFAIPEANG